MKKVDYYFDFLSPFSYFSWKNTTDLRSNPNVQLTLKPVVMGTLFNNWEIKGPGEVAPKRLLMLKQCFQYAAMNNIDFIPPKTHPFNPLYALRLATTACAQDNQEKIIDRLWNTCWGQGQELGEAEFLENILCEIGLDGKALIEKTFDREVKMELKKNTKEAIAMKAFGVPSFVYEGELYWGNDSLDYLKLVLEGKGPDWDKEMFKDRTSDIIPQLNTQV